MTLSDFDIWYRSRYRRTSSALTATAMILADIWGIMVSFGTGFFLVNLYDLSAINFRSFVTYWPYLPLFIVVFQIAHLYPGVSLAPAEELRHFCISSLMAHGGIIFSRFIEDREFDSISIAFIISFSFSTVILLVCRSIMRTLLRKSKLGGIPAVIYGGGEMGRLVIDKLLNNHALGYVPVLILDNNSGIGDIYRGIYVLHDTSLGPEIVKRYRIKMAIVAMPNLNQDELSQILNTSVSAFRYNVFIPQFFVSTNIWMSVREFDGILGFATSDRLKMPWNHEIKRLIDLSLTILGGLIILPFLLFLALLIKITSPGPVLYTQPRIGKNGKVFQIYKFRSMIIDADKRLKEVLDASPEMRNEYEIHRKLKDDPRITGIGKLLRRTSFDEFPQLLNVLKGDMSLVGPRPILADEIQEYGVDFKRNFSVLPGMTGLWQISGRSDTDNFFTAHVFYDTYYFQSWSVWLDLWILYKTVGVVVRGKGAY
ncbi:undecaprenyl-phosphate galactose phosphotransferase WbaP [Treponema primitia]|uniref:undecaprenyl-phosphate galactose phosphotransferase WbaP n=1 Tax=Treponema primitia TaxID=88058 RepID=UPI00397FB7DE